jgi:hypothetical protein
MGLSSIDMGDSEKHLIPILTLSPFSNTNRKAAKFP